MNILQKLRKAGKINPPSFLPDNICYLAIVGSHGYGVAEDGSDMDVVGCCFPPKHYLFPSFCGEIEGFDKGPRFDTWDECHIFDDDDGQEYDFKIYSIAKYFRMLAQPNPNILDSLFVPQRCVMYTTPAMEIIRENREIFLTKECYAPFKGMAISHLKRIKNEKSKHIPQKRQAIVDTFGYDVKDAYHLIRILLELKMILDERTIDTFRNRELLNSIRKGHYSFDDIHSLAEHLERGLAQSKEASNIPEHVDREAVKVLLMNAIESHYDNIKKILPNNEERIAIETVEKIKRVLENSGI